MRLKLLLLFTIIIVCTLLLYFVADLDNHNVLGLKNDESSVFEKFLPKFNTLQRSSRFKNLTDVTKGKEGTFGIYIKDLDSGATFAFNETELFYAASLFKTPLAASVLKLVDEGALKLDNENIYTQSDYSDGTGSIAYNSYGLTYTYDQLLDLLLKESDNSAQNIIMRTIGAPNAENAFKLIPLKNHFFENNTATPEQIAIFYEKLVMSNYLKKDSLDSLLERMKSTLFDDRVHLGLEENVEFAHKIGNWPDTSTWHDCGLVIDENNTIVVCLMSRYTTLEDFNIVAKSTGEFVNYLLD